MNGCRVLVTGACGFVGRHFCVRAEERGWQVRRVLRTPAADGDDDVVVGDLLACDVWPQVLTGVDVVVHLAARVHQMQESHVDVENAYRTMNAGLTRRLVEQSVAAGVKRFVFVSTIKVNGEFTQGRPFVETDVPAPTDWYARTKLEAEEALRELAEAAGMEWVVVRPPLVFGDGVRGNFESLIRAVRRHFPLPIGSVRARRSYVNVWNLADLLELCCAQPAAAGQVFLAADCTLPTVELVRQLARQMKRWLILLPVPVRVLKWAACVPGASKAIDRLTASLEVDSGKARCMLGWQASVGFEEALRRTLAGSPPAQAKAQAQAERA